MRQDDYPQMSSRALWPPANQRWLNFWRADFRAPSIRAETCFAASL